MQPFNLREASCTPLKLTRGVTGTRFGASMCSPWFPPRDPPVGSALPSTGSSGASSPASQVLRRCATPWLPFAALRCLRLAIPNAASVLSLPAVPNAQPRARGSSSGPLDRKLFVWRGSGSPRFPGNPGVSLPCSRTLHGMTNAIKQSRRSEVVFLFSWKRTWAATHLTSFTNDLTGHRQQR